MKSKSKLNFVINGIGNSGGIKVIFEYARQFQQKGLDVVIYFPIIPYNLKNTSNLLKRAYSFCRSLIGNFFKYIILRKHKKMSLQVIPVYKINNYTIRDADYTIATAWPTAYDVANLNKNKGKLCYFIQDYEIWDNEKLGKASYDLPLKKITISQWIYNKLEEINQIDNCIVVNNGLDIEKYNYNKNFETRKRCINCLLLAHNLPKKGMKNGISAFEKAKKINPNLHLIIFGTTKNNLIPTYADFFENPSQEKIVELYNNADIYIYPSITEGWGLTVVEAMASQCAVVGTNTGCLIEIGKNGENALISEVNDIDDMANNIIKLSNNNELRTKIALNGFKTVQNFSWENASENFIKALEKL